MQEFYETEGPLRFCKLTIMSNDDDNELKIRLWLNRVMDPDGYSHYMDYATATDEWRMCLTTYEQEQLERYLWENNVTNFTFEVCKDKRISGLIAVSDKEK